ncbi:MAG: hypothetical protein LBO65_02445, partial [Spirochaetaceae bacterium]|nr:hypothetical protein [Spirochaetaceae bacterium]
CNSAEFFLESSSSFLSVSLSPVSLVDISSNLLSSLVVGSAGSEGKAESGDKDACDKAAAKSKEERNLWAKGVVFILHALFRGIELQPLG